VSTQWAFNFEKAVYRSVFLTISHCNLCAELTKTHSFFGHFAHWERPSLRNTKTRNSIQIYVF